MGNLQIVKKDGQIQNWRPEKIRAAMLLANKRTKEEIDQKTLEQLADKVKEKVPEGTTLINVNDVHELVMQVLREEGFQDTFSQYASYRNYKKIFSNSFVKGYEESTKILYDGDKENANKDSSLNSTKQALIAGNSMKKFMINFVMRKEWIDAHNQGYIHIHDLAERFLNGHNCNFFRMFNVMKGGFELNGIMYNEPGGVQKAFDVAGDLVLSASAQQYGGFTVSYIDEGFEPYAEKTYNKAYKHFYEELIEDGIDEEIAKKSAEKLANKQTIREIQQGYQGFETKLNTVSNSLGQTPFVTITLGLMKGKWARIITKTVLETRMNGIGQKKTTAVFPKIVFLYRSEINGKGSPNYDLYQLAIKCSSIRLYPDYLSGDAGYQKEIYEECGRMVSPMGCRAYLGRFYHPITGELVIEGRANIGAVSLNLPMLALESNGDREKFKELIDKYAKMVFDIHLETYEKVGKSKGSIDPLFYCEGGAWMSVGYDEEIAPVLEGFTASLGYVGIEEACQVFFHEPLCKHVEDFGTPLVQYLWDTCMYYKEKHGKLYTLYATPAESLIKKFQEINQKKFGIIPGVTDKAYMTNSFHMHVTQKLAAPEKITLESPMFNISQGGRITYCEWPYGVDTKVLEQNVTYAMTLGQYHGVNIESSTCNNCGYQSEITGVCPNCGSNDITSVDRCCGYLSYKRVKGDSRYNSAKEAEIADRVDHYSPDVAITK